MLVLFAKNSRYLTEVEDLILNKSSLLIVGLCTADKNISVLNTVRIEPDGTTVAANGRTLLLVSPLNDEVKKQVPLRETEKSLGDGVTLSADGVNEVLKLLPRDTLFGGLLEHCNVEESVEDSHSVAVEVTDGKRKKILYCPKYRGQFLEYKEAVKESLNKKVVYRTILNRKRLSLLLKVIDQVCPDSTGESPVFIEFAEDGELIIKGINYRTGQRAIGFMSNYRGNWLEESPWENRLRFSRVKRWAKRNKNTCHKK